MANPSPVSYPSSSASAFISGQPSISVAQEKIQVVKHSRNKGGGTRAGEPGDWSVFSRFGFIIRRTSGYLQRSGCIIISISLRVSGGLSKKQTKGKFKFFSLCHAGLDPNFKENIRTGAPFGNGFCQKLSSHNVNIAFNDSISLQFPYQSSYNRLHLFAFPSLGHAGLLLWEAVE